jgi:hypothetical protein
MRRVIDLFFYCLLTVELRVLPPPDKFFLY